MSAIQKALSIYGSRFAQIHGVYSEHGYVVSTPTTLCFGRPCMEQDWQLWTTLDKADAWWVEMVIGSGALSSLIKQFPFPLPRVGWQRGANNDDRPRFYNYERLTKFSR
jgi:hypothetical protein